MAYEKIEEKVKNAQNWRIQPFRDIAGGGIRTHEPYGIKASIKKVLGIREGISTPCGFKFSWKIPLSGSSG